MNITRNLKISCQSLLICFCVLLITLFFTYCENKNNPAAIPAELTGEVPPETPKQKEINDLYAHIVNVFNKINLPQHKQEHIHNDISENGEFLKDLLLILEGEHYHRVLVDKSNSLGPGYEPSQLVDISSGQELTTNLMLTREAYEAVNDLISAAGDEGHNIYVISAYRSYNHQGRTYVYWVSIEGQEQADRISARPGHSQHQLGLTVDFNMLDNELALTPEGIWLADNASRFGWSLSYPDGYEELTGYAYESWHHRYVGKNVSAFIDKYFNSIQQYALMFIHEFAAEFQDAGELASLITSIYEPS